ncbi:MAG: NAD(P)/FAD-dependent oxidoreductase [Bacillota bacterium]
MNYVIIGNSAAAIGAVEGIRQVDKKGQITIISEEPYHTYSRPLISYWLAGKVSADNMIYRDGSFYEANSVTPLLGRKAVSVDPKGKKVVLDDGDTVKYDKLLVATGGKPIMPPMKGLDKEGVYTFIKFDDVKAIQEVAAPGKKAVVIGAGLIGLKAAEALLKLGLDITVVELANRVLSAILDEGAGAMVQGCLEDAGIKFELNTTVKEVGGGKKVTGVTLENGKKLDCDLLVVAIGVQPNTDVIKDSGIQVNRGIVVDEHMRTSSANVYAAGDVAEGFDLVSGANRVLPLLPNAYMQGEVAGRNMAGAETVFAGGMAMNAIGFYDLPMLTAGIIKPDSDAYEVLTEADPATRTYRKIVIKDNRLVGYICLNKVDRAGILTGLIRDKVNIGEYKESLARPDFGYVHFPQEFRQDRLTGGITG